MDKAVGPLEADNVRGGGGEGDGPAKNYEYSGERTSAAHFLVLMEVDKAVGLLGVEGIGRRGRKDGCGPMDLSAVPVCPHHHNKPGERIDASPFIDSVLNGITSPLFCANLTPLLH